jgi:hypothetical protein
MFYIFGTSPVLGWIWMALACPHHLKFHRFSFCASTDEDFYPEKESSTSLVPSLLGSCESESESVDDIQGLACTCVV